MSELVLSARNFIFDLDGCLWFGDRLAPGAARLVAALRSARRGVFFLTNISTAPAANLAERLTRLGIAAEPGAIVAPLDLLGHHPAIAKGCRALVIGKEAVGKALEAAGAEVVTEADEVSVVVLGSDPKLTFAELTAAAQALDKGAVLLALNLDRRVPSKNGTYVPGVGALAALLTTATGVKPQLVGKPSRFYFEEALRRFAIPARDSVMVGDSLVSDVAGGKKVGLRTVLVGEGVGKAAVRPDVQVANLSNLHRLLSLP